MAPTIIPRTPSTSQLHHLSQSITSAFKSLTVRDVTSTGTPLCSVFALVLSHGTSVSRRALTSLSDLALNPSPKTNTITPRSLTSSTTPHLLKRQNVILAIPTTYKGLNAGPQPGAVVGIMLGSIFGFLLCLYILLLSFQFFGNRTTVVEKEVIVKRRSHSKSKSRRSSHHSAAVVTEHITIAHSPPPPRRSQTIVEVEEEIIRHHSPSLEEVIVEEEESLSEDIVEVIEEQTVTSQSSPSPPPRRQSSARRSGYRVVDPAEFGGGDAPMNRINRRTSRQ